MNKEDFEIIQNKLQERIDLCKKYLGCLDEENDLNELSVRQVRDIKAFCDSEIKIQTRILMVDLYHVIGMGNLSVSQTGAFLKAIKEYSDYRPIIKTVNKMALDFNNMPKIIKASSFRLLELDVTLHRGNSDEVDQLEPEIETVETYKDFVDDKNEIAEEEEVQEFWPEGTYDERLNKIKVAIGDVPKMAKFLCRNVKTFKALSEASLRKAMLDGKDYAGIKWVNSSDGYRIGIANSTLKEFLVELFK